MNSRISSRPHICPTSSCCSLYKDEGLAGIGGGVKNYLAYGGFPLDDDWNKTLLPRGVVKNGDISKPLALDENKIAEEVTHSWYKGDRAAASL